MTRSEFDALIENPYIYAHMIGFDLLTPFHDNWINKLLWRDEDYTLQAHRDSYKTTCLIVAVTLAMILRPEDTILLLRKESGSTMEFIRAVKRCLLHPVTQDMARLLYNHEIELVKDTQTEIHTNLFKNEGAKESQLVADGIRSFAITGKHFKRIYTDDIVTLKDRISNAERIQTDNVYQELQNIRTKDGVIINTGTPWHKMDTFRLMPEPEIWTIYDTGLFDEEGIKKKRTSMTASLFSANYELKHVADEDCLFPNPKYESYPFVDGIAHIDASYGGDDTTALTVMCKKDGKLYGYGKIWKSHVQNHYNEIVSLLQKYKAGTLYMERNADKGYVAKEMMPLYPNISTYSEHMNKHIKISTHLKSAWDNIYWANETDPNYMEQVVDYQENQGHDDAPDSASCVVRVLDKGEMTISRW
jgi:hypothetical protein